MAARKKAVPPKPDPVDRPVVAATPAPGLSQYRKALVAVLGAIASAVSLGVIPAPYDQYVTVALAVLTSAGVYVAPNAKPIEGD